MVKACCALKEELTVTQDGILLSGNRIIIPEKLHTNIIEIAHQGHQGVTKTLELLKEKVWFPQMNRKVTENIENCL